MRASRIDTSHGPIADAFRDHGYEVLSLAHVGKGVPDLLVCRHGRLSLIECKTGNARTKPETAVRQLGFAQRFPVLRLTSPREAIDWILSQ